MGEKVVLTYARMDWKSGVGCNSIRDSRGSRRSTKKVENNGGMST